MKKKYFFLAISLLIINCILQFSCTKTSSYNNNTTTPLPGDSGVTITIRNMFFSPASKTVANGTVITWNNEDSYSHTVTSDDGFSFSSSTIKGGDKYVSTATKAGTFKYHCTIHGMAMSGTLIVNP